MLLAALASFASRMCNWCLLDRLQFYGLVDVASFVWRISNWCLQDRLDFCGDWMQTWICNVLCASNIWYKVVFLSLHKNGCYVKTVVRNHIRVAISTVILQRGQPKDFNRFLCHLHPKPFTFFLLTLLVSVCWFGLISFFYPSPCLQD
jgi:hypothetical protein